MLKNTLIAGLLMTTATTAMAAFPDLYNYGDSTAANKIQAVTTSAITGVFPSGDIAVVTMGDLDIFNVNTTNNLPTGYGLVTAVKVRVYNATNSQNVDGDWNCTFNTSNYLGSIGNQSVTQHLTYRATTVDANKTVTAITLNNNYTNGSYSGNVFATCTKV